MDDQPGRRTGIRLHTCGSKTEQEIGAIAEGVLRALSQTFRLGDKELRLHAASALRLPLDAATAEELETAAFAATHAAMSQPGSNFELYAHAMRDALAEALWLDSQLHEALDRGEFELWYQPKLAMDTGAVHSVEALIRWKHPQAGYIAPDRFIPRAEATGSIVRIGRWVAHAAAMQAKAWAAKGRPLRVAINVSARQVVHDASLAETLKAAQALCGGLIDVELTESSFMENAQAATRFVDRCRAIGCGVHLDDFGTGYSSLGQIAALNLTAVKLDRSFIADQCKGVKQQAMLEAIACLAKALALDLIAEGVETLETECLLRTLGVTLAQGWHYSKAVPASELESWLDTHEAESAHVAIVTTAPV